MKSRTRPFQVEVRRAKGPSSRPFALTKEVFRLPLLSPLLQGAPHELAGEGLWKQPMLERADPLLDPRKARAPMDLGSAQPETAAGSPVRRVLPDLRSPTAAEETQRKVRETRPQARSKRKATALRYAAMRVLHQDQEKLTSDAVPELPDPGSPNEAGNTGSEPIAPAAAVSASPPPRKTPVTRLPRGERWKERRLPRVCWSKTKPSAR